MNKTVIDKDLVSVKSYLDKFCGMYAGRVFMRSAAGKEYTYARLREDSLALARALLAKGYKGKHVAVLSENRYEFMVTFFAVLLAGAVFVPLPLNEPSEKLAQMIAFADVTVACVTDKTAPLLASVTGISRFSLDGTGENTLYGLTEEGRSLPETAYYGDFFGNETAALCFTSGTSAGKPKSVMLTARNLFVAAIYRVTPIYMDFGGGIERETVLYTPLPLFHLAGLVCCALEVAILFGCTFVTGANVAEFFTDVKKANAQIIVAVPALAEALYRAVMDAVDKAGDRESFDKYCRECDMGMYTPEERREYCSKYTSVFGKQLVIMGTVGAVSDVSILKRYGYLGIHVGCDYGLTECSPQVTIASTAVPQRAGSVGILCDFNDGKLVDGVLYVKGDNVMKGYYKNPEGTKAVLSEDGWLCTGDLAEIDEDGYVFIKGRANSVAVLSNGENIDVDELTSRFLTLPSVQEIIIMADRKNHSDTLGALVYPAEGFTAQQVADDMAKINSELPVLKKVVRYRLVDKPFEKNGMMKIKRFMYLNEEI